MSSRIRVQLWDHITRELNLSSQTKLLLLVIANYTDARSLKAHAPLSLLILRTGLREPEATHLLDILAASEYVRRSQPPVTNSLPIPLYDLRERLVRDALRNP
ncbi:hypothetical protein [Leptolyngbya sp. FACHB-261]|uniref:hypothetical protein n=1 Tax=Leptolyngbya sp. FACHB-261 TaxID=2692806 RepID=UPI0016831186|nr:hypothetical protein [Leptolyngbya sp. FACHB-261]MBD2102718.1 hypothetical protein [Leptolyngbya sp. FACHB-261]